MEDKLLPLSLNNMTTSTISTPKKNQIERFLEDDLLTQSTLDDDTIVVGGVVLPIILETYSGADRRGPAKGVWTTTSKMLDDILENVKGVTWSARYDRHIAPRRLKTQIELYVRYEIERRLQEGRCLDIL